MAAFLTKNDDKYFWLQRILSTCENSFVQKKKFFAQELTTGVVTVKEKKVMIFCKKKKKCKSRAYNILIRRHPTHKSSIIALITFEVTTPGSIKFGKKRLFFRYTPAIFLSIALLLREK